MPLFDKLIGQIVKRGRLEITYHDGRRSVVGVPEEGYPDVAMSFADAKVPCQIMLDPRLGTAEAYMDGRLRVERGDIMKLVQLIRANQAWDRGGKMHRPTVFRRVKSKLSFVTNSFNRATSAKRNAST